MSHFRNQFILYNKSSIKDVKRRQKYTSVCQNPNLGSLGLSYCSHGDDKASSEEPPPDSSTAGVGAKLDTARNYQ